MCKRLIQLCLSDMLDYIKNDSNIKALNKYLEMFDILKSIYSKQIEEYLKK